LQAIIEKQNTSAVQDSKNHLTGSVTPVRQHSHTGETALQRTASAVRHCNIASLRLTGGNLVDPPPQVLEDLPGRDSWPTFQASLHFCSKRLKLEGSQIFLVFEHP
jgi:hypothetical protein